jgi:hypothetical protein
MTRAEILKALTEGLIEAGFIAVDDMSESEEIFLRAHTGRIESDDTPLTHVNFTPNEIAYPDDEAIAMMIASRVEMAKQSAAERTGIVAAFNAKELAAKELVIQQKQLHEKRMTAEAERYAMIDKARALLSDDLDQSAARTLLDTLGG